MGKALVITLGNPSLEKLEFNNFSFFSTEKNNTIFPTSCACIPVTYSSKNKVH